MNFTLLFNLLPEQHRTRAKNVANVTSVVAVRGVGVVVAFIMNVLVARIFGAVGAGTFFLFRSWSQTFVGLGGGGVSQYVLREAARNIGCSQKVRAWHFINRATIICFIVGLALALLTMLLPAEWASRVIKMEGASFVLKAAAIGAAFIFAIQILCAGFKACEMPQRAIFLETLIMPIAGVLFLCGLYFARKSITIQTFICFLILTLAASLILAVFLWFKNRPYHEKYVDKVQSFCVRDFLNPSIFKIWVASILNVINWSMIFYFLPFYATKEEIGGIGVCLKIASMLQSVIVTALASIYAPKFSQLRRSGKTAELKRQFFRGATYGFLFIAPATVIIFIFK